VARSHRRFAWWFPATSRAIVASSGPSGGWTADTGGNRGDSPLPGDIWPARCAVRRLVARPAVDWPAERDGPSDGPPAERDGPSDWPRDWPRNGPRDGSREWQRNGSHDGTAR
jgi:hypothetical protein